MYADRILINKIDLLSGEGESVDDVINAVTELNCGSSIKKSVKGVVQLDDKETFAHGYNYNDVKNIKWLTEVGGFSAPGAFCIPKEQHLDYVHSVSIFLEGYVDHGKMEVSSEGPRFSVTFANLPPLLSTLLTPNSDF